MLLHHRRPWDAVAAGWGWARRRNAGEGQRCGGEGREVQEVAPPPATLGYSRDCMGGRCRRGAAAWWGGPGRWGRLLHRQRHKGRGRDRMGLGQARTGDAGEGRRGGGEESGEGAGCSTASSTGMHRDRMGLGPGRQKAGRLHIRDGRTPCCATGYPRERTLCLTRCKRTCRRTTVIALRAVAQTFAAHRSVYLLPRSDANLRPYCNVIRR